LEKQELVYMPRQQLAIKNFLCYFEWTERLGSTLEKNNRTLFYPGISASFIPTAAIEALKGSRPSII